ncbi:vWA domain-containing protein [Porticoccus sp. GXU_MW_L64]
MKESIDLIFDGSSLHSMQGKLAGFLTHLKKIGFQVDIDHQIIAQQLLAKNDFFDRFGFELALRTLLCKNKKQWKLFADIYKEYWMHKQNPNSLSTSKPEKNAPINGFDDGKSDQSSLQPSTGKERPNKSHSNQQVRSDIASSQDFDEEADFSFLDDPDLLAMYIDSCRALIRKLARKSRKKHRTRKPDVLDIRSTISNNFKNGGELLDVIFWQRPQMPPRFTVVIDVSRSMSVYSDAFLVFAMAMVNLLPTVRVFLFNTRLAEATQTLRNRNLNVVKYQLEQLSGSWGGGTKIATNLNKLKNYNLWKKRSNHHVIVHSDGLDTDPPKELARVLKRLKTGCRNLFWLSPLLKNANYRVETGALKNALQYIDYLLPVHNFQNLKNLVELIENHGASEACRKALEVA